MLTAAADEAGRGFRVDPVALAEAVRLAKRVADETGLAPARVDGLLALKGVVVQEENASLDDEARMARDAAHAREPRERLRSARPRAVERRRKARGGAS